jgi:hypothetical protein
MKKLLVKFNDEIIAQTQGSDEELAQWLAGDSFKYPEGYWVEYIDISAQAAQEQTNQQALTFLASTDWKVLRHIRQKALGETTSLTEEEYLALELQRSQVAASIIH